MVEIASSHDFPHFSEPPEAQLQLAMKDQQSKFRNDLDFQVAVLGGRARQRPGGAACANDKGGAVWDAFRENANRGDPVGTLSGPSRVRVHLAGA